jgi:NAD(P)-dependent dehydrogenase (short-subunit alcohol dehydrogenase family)
VSSQRETGTARVAVDGARAGGLVGLRLLVTGGASGIGHAVTAAALARGAHVAVLDLDPATAPEGALRVAGDVTDDSSVNAAVDQAAAAMGSLDILVNNAGVGAQGTIETNPLDEWHQVFDVNVLGMVRVTRAALPHLRRSPHASVVNMCSIAATAGLPDRALYSATKGAVLSLTLAMAADHIHDGIRVNCVNPGTTDTPWIDRLLDRAPDPAAERAALESRQPSGRLVTPQEVAAAVLHLAGPSASATTGTSLAVDGGMAGLRIR